MTDDQSQQPDRLAHMLGRPTEPRLANSEEWQQLMSQARRAGLHGRLALAVLGHVSSISTLTPPFVDAPEAVLPSEIPAGMQPHLESAALVCRRLADGMLLEVDRLTEALQRGGHRVVLLKGAAYLCGGLPPSRGRVFGDIDILVPRDSLPEVERALMSGGWISTEPDAYNQRYYRQWMHEIPPLTHVRRGTTVDVHHTIVPPTSAFRVAGDQLLRAARQVGQNGQLWVLQPTDMVLHSAVHLFTEGEFDRGLRDLLDLRDLLVHFGMIEPSFWPKLFARADELALGRPLHHALTHVARLFGSCVPGEFLPAIRVNAPPWPQRIAMCWLLTQALRPPHPCCDSRFSTMARRLLYLRAHWLRMPLYLLVPHLAHKAWKGVAQARSRSQAIDAQALEVRR